LVALTAPADDDTALATDARDAAARAVVQRHWPRVVALVPTAFPSDGVMVRQVESEGVWAALLLRPDGRLSHQCAQTPWFDQTVGAAGGALLLVALFLFIAPAPVTPLVAVSLAVGAQVAGTVLCVLAMRQALAVRRRVVGGPATARELRSAVQSLATAWAARHDSSTRSLVAPLRALVAELDAVSFAPALEPS